MGHKSDSAVGDERRGRVLMEGGCGEVRGYEKRTNPSLLCSVIGSVNIASWHLHCRLFYRRGLCLKLRRVDLRVSCLTALIVCTLILCIFLPPPHHHAFNYKVVLCFS